MIAKILGTLPLFLAFCPAALLAQGCTDANFSGTYFFLGTGYGPVSYQPFALLGKEVADGKGGLTGQWTQSANGVISTLPFTGSYTLASDCSGTQSVSLSYAGTVSMANNNFQLVEGGRSLLLASSVAGSILTGQGWRAAAQPPAQCGNFSLSGRYGAVGSGPGLGYFPFSEITGVTFDGQRGLTGSGILNDANPPYSATSGVPQAGSGSYSVSSDCSGTTTFGGEQDAFAIVEGGRLLVLETDSGTLFTGVAEPQSTPMVMGQLAFGGGWYSALYFTNSTSAAVSFPVNFLADDGTALAVPSLGTTATVAIPANGTAVLEALNQGALSEGYATFSLPAGVAGYGLFRQSVGGIADQEAVVPFAAADSSGSSFAWDETNYTTAIAIVNPSASASTITIDVSDNNGNTVGSSPLHLPPYNKTEEILRTLPGLSGMAGLRGTARITSTGGAVAVLGLRFNGAAFTSIPAQQ